MAAAITTTATTLEGQMLEVSKALQGAELAVPAIGRPNRITISPDLEALEVTVTVTLPITISGTGGSLSLVADTYL